MINWLASYPKSGNTWVRIFLDAYVWDCEPDINYLRSSQPDNHYMLYDIGFNVPDPLTLSHLEQVMIRPAALLRLDAVFKAAADKGDKGVDLPLIIKTHNANAILGGINLIPPQISSKVILLVRDPRDVALSYARHRGVSADDVVTSMCLDNGLIEHKEIEGVKSYPMSWSQHTRSYFVSKNLDVAIFRYEDLLTHPVKAFSAMLAHYGMTVDEARVKRAIKACELSKLKKQEDDNGFREAMKTTKFFDGGNGEKLSLDNIVKLEEHAGEMMQQFGYLKQKKEAA